LVEANKRVAWRGISFGDDYKHTHAKCTATCPIGHSWQVIPNGVLAGNGCPFCAGKARVTRDAANLRVAGRGLVFGEDYTGVEVFCSTSCVCGNVWRTKPQDIFAEHGCPACATGTTDNDCIYIWRDDAQAHEDRSVFKIGITSWEDGDARMKKCAQRRGTSVSALRRWQVRDARVIEAAVLDRWQVNPVSDRLDGHSEFRALTPADYRDLVLFVEAHPDYATD
jgi:hypothetical protein